MLASKSNIIDQLRKDILSLQGFASPARAQDLFTSLGPIDNVFPNHHFPLRAVHEFIAGTAESRAATSGFIAGMLSAIMRRHGVIIWIGSKLQVFPHAFQSFGIDPDKIIFVSLEKEKDVLWAIEESLKSEGLSAVVGEVYGLSFDISRRLQLAVEKSHITGFIINRNTRSVNATACVSRWQISALPSEVYEEMPGIGFPRWNVELLKVRNGRTGRWQVEWNAGKFHFIPETKAIEIVERRKTG
jgi:protein ImuA